MQIQIKISGLVEINRALNALPKRLDKKLLDKALIQGAMLVRDEARRRVPLLREPDARRRRGTLQRAIRAARVRPERYRATVYVRVRRLTFRQVSNFKKRAAKKGHKWSGAYNPNDPYYWVFVEFGTSKWPGQKFMRPAFESHKVQAVERIAAVSRTLVQDEIKKIAAATGVLSR